MTIRLRLALMFTVVTCLLLLSGGALFVANLRSALEKDLNETAMSSADNITASIPATATAASLAKQGRRGVSGAIRGSYAQLIESNGRLVAASRGLPKQSMLTTAQLHVAAAKEVFFDAELAVPELADNPQVSPESVRVFARPVGRMDVVLAVAVSRDVVDTAVQRSRNQLLLLGLGVLLLAGPGSWLLTRAALRPVERMRLQVRAMDETELDARSANTVAQVPLQVPRTRDEIARLAQTFNGMLTRLHDALARERTLVADAGHELRTPLTVLRGELELARRPGRTRAELAETVEVAAEVTDQLVKLTEDLLFLSSDLDGYQRTTEPFVVSEVVASAVHNASPLASSHEVHIHVRGDDQLLGAGHPDWIRRAIYNVLANAVRYSPPNADVVISVTRSESDIRIAIADSGPGFPADFLPHAFERFTRADDARGRTSALPADTGGSGLGLAIVWSIMARHRGHVTARNRADDGAEVVLSWPGAVDRIEVPDPAVTR